MCQARSISYAHQRDAQGGFAHRRWGEAYNGWDQEGHATSHKIEESMITCDAPNENVHIVEIACVPIESTRCSPTEVNHLLYK